MKLNTAVLHDDLMEHSSSFPVIIIYLYKHCSFLHWNASECRVKPNWGSPCGDPALSSVYLLSRRALKRQPCIPHSAVLKQTPCELWICFLFIDVWTKHNTPEHKKNTRMNGRLLLFLMNFLFHLCLWFLKYFQQSWQ